jgi:ABC-type polysaccharide/polyol phosphate transport system ATPase subunit
MASKKISHKKISISEAVEEIRSQIIDAQKHLKENSGTDIPIFKIEKIELELKGVFTSQIEGEGGVSSKSGVFNVLSGLGLEAKGRYRRGHESAHTIKLQLSIDETVTSPAQSDRRHISDS